MPAHDLKWTPDAGFVVAPSAPYSVWKAVQEVRDDFARVAGFDVRSHALPETVVGLPVIVESDGALAAELGLDDRFVGPEAFLISRVRIEGRDAVLVSGRDELGAIFGIYHFSEMELGTDPFQFWTGTYPDKRSSLVLKEVEYASPRPTFRYRGFFLEGIHAITGWRSPDETVGYNLFYEKAFETMLRCKCNMVKPNTNEPSSMEVGLAQRMGLLIGQEHCAQFGIGMFFPPPYPGFVFSWKKNRETFLRAWEDALRRFPRPDRVIWTLGHRGRDDRGFWFDDAEMPDHPTDEQKAEVINDVMKAQRDLIMRLSGEHKPVFVHNLWMEGVRLYRNGHVKPPEGTILVWADNGYGAFRAMLAAGCNAQDMCDARPEQPTGGTHGSYYHVSMWDYNTPFYAEFVPPERIHREYAHMIAMEATGYAIVNVGRLRPHLVGAAAIAELTWQAGPWADPNSDAGGDFLTRWCRRHFGDLADEAKACYRALYEHPIRHGEWGGWDDLICGDVGYVRRVRVLVNRAISRYAHDRYMKPDAASRFFMNRNMTLPEQIAYLKPKVTDAVPKWDDARQKARAVADRLEGNAKEFFVGTVQAPIELNRGLNRFLDIMLDAIALYLDGRYADVRRTITEARAMLEEARAGLALACRGRWAGWYDLEKAVPFPAAELVCSALDAAAEEVQRGE